MLRLQESKDKQARKRDKGLLRKIFSISSYRRGWGRGWLDGSFFKPRKPLLNVPIASPDIGFYLRVQKIESLPYFL
jgi:hypothetical protein